MATELPPIFPSKKPPPLVLREPPKLEFPVSGYARSKTPAQLYAEETATIDVNGKRFSDWETVMVELPWAESEPHFKFTTADQIEIPQDWHLLQFKPGDECAIYLGGYLAIAGVIVTRQVAYDANNHGVMLDGVGVQWYAARASIVPEGNESVGNYDGMSFKQVADAVLNKTGIKCMPVGILDATPFARLQCEPGETIWAFLERIARPRGIVMGSDNLGNLLAIGKHTYPPTADLIEGVNIKKAQVTITVENNHNFYLMYGSTPADDSQNGTDASEQKAQVPGSATRYSPLLTTAEQPVWSKAELQARAASEARWHEGTIIQATITVQGWMRPSDNMLWEPGSNIRVWSPMAMLINEVLKVQTVKYMQSRQGGTETVLELVVPWLLGDTGFTLPVPVPALPHLPFAVPPLKLE